MDVTRRKVDKITMMSGEGAVTFHLNLKRAANNHRCFAGGMPVKRSDTSRSESSKDNGWSFGGVAPLNSYSKAFRGIRDGTKFGCGGWSNDWFFFRTLCRQMSCADDAYCTEKNKKSGNLFENH